MADDDAAMEKLCERRSTASSFQNGEEVGLSGDGSYSGPREAELKALARGIDGQRTMGTPHPPNADAAAWASVLG
jgi:hypothetical protein